MRKFLLWILNIDPYNKTYYHCYGEGTHSRLLGDTEKHNPYTYGTFEHDAWSDGYNGRI